MTDPRAADNAPLNPPDPDRQAHLTQLEGREAREDQDAVVAASDVESLDALSDTEVYEGNLEALGAQAVDPGEAALHGLGSLDLRAEETADPNVAAEEGEPWVPPIDPPVVADADAEGGIRVAAGFGTTAGDEPFDADHHGEALPADDEVTARVREALAADARTSRLADRVGIDTEAGRVTIRGSVDDLEDADLLVAVASEVAGVTEVADETDVDGL